MRDIRQLDPRTESDLTPLLDAAFEGTAESTLVAALRDDAAAWLPALSLGAYDGEELVGYVLLTRVTVGESAVPALSLAPVAVLPDRQRAGIGDALTRAAIDRAREAGEGAVIVLGHPAYYPRFGFVPAGERGIDAPWDVPVEAWMVLELAPGGLAELNGRVRFPAAFDAAV